MVKGPREVTSVTLCPKKWLRFVFSVGSIVWGLKGLGFDGPRQLWISVSGLGHQTLHFFLFLSRIEMASLPAVWSWGKDRAFEGLSLAHCLLCWVKIRSWPFFICLLGLQAPGEGRSGQGSHSFPVAHSQCVPARNVCWTNGWVDMNDGMFEFEWHDITNLCLLSSCWESPSCWARGVFLFICGSSPVFRTVILNNREKELPLGFL